MPSSSKLTEKIDGGRMLDSWLWSSWTNSWPRLYKIYQLGRSTQPRVWRLDHTIPPSPEGLGDEVPAWSSLLRKTKRREKLGGEEFVKVVLYMDLLRSMLSGAYGRRHRDADPSALNKSGVLLHMIVLGQHAGMSLYEAI